MPRVIASALWFLATAALTYPAVFATYWFGYYLTGGVNPPPPPPALTLPALPKVVDVVLLLVGPCVLAGSVVWVYSRWWAGLIGGIGLGLLSGALLYLSVGHRPTAPVFAAVAWVVGGFFGTAVALFRYQIRGGSGVAPDPA